MSGQGIGQPKGLRFNFQDGALAEVLPNGTWVVSCARCFSDIGTMAIVTLKNAISVNRNRGGVLCVECRKSVCNACGLVVTEGGLCKVCELERLVDSVRSEDDADV